MTMMTTADYQKLFELRCKSKSGCRLTDEEQRFCKQMFAEYPTTYANMSNAVFNETQPFEGVP